MKKINSNIIEGNATHIQNKRKRRTSRLAFASFLMIGSCSGLLAQAHASSFERLSSLLAATPEGGWVKASTNFYSDAWPTGADAVPGGWPGAVAGWLAMITPALVAIPLLTLIQRWLHLPRIRAAVDGIVIASAVLLVGSGVTLALDAIQQLMRLKS